jgi:hypothetical protein
VVSVLAVAVSTTHATAATPQRQVVLPYTGPGATPVATFAATGQGSGVGGVTVAVHRGERRLMLVGSDQTGLRTKYDVTQLVDSARGVYVDLGDVCGSTSQPLTLVAATAPVVIFPEAGVCDELPSVPTRGTVRVSFR